MNYICIKVDMTAGFTAYKVGDVFELIENEDSKLISKEFPNHFLLKHLNTGVMSYHWKVNFRNIQEERDIKLKELLE